ncbi:MAG TPA: 5-(carboxyamino)imidazole ribonucleotide mutase [Moorella mulderi]|nr:5-(carboxyamino)imidazole ribonucleotide mutase [Moorella mulderi]
MAKVAIIMGSDTDLKIMAQAASVLEDFQVPYEMRILSAHRALEAVEEYARKAASQDIKVIIAGAGGAAHLPGVLAACTPLPVIGVPLSTSPLHGVDALYSIVQMPRGIPVATVAVDGAANAALLAVEILALQEERLRARLKEYREDMRRGLLKKDAHLKEVGWKNYLEEKKAGT